MTAPISSGPWHEIQGQSPVDGQWHAVYHVDDYGTARKTLAMVIDSDDPMYDRWDDFRLAPPSPARLKRKAREDARRETYRRSA